jgi:hypothetical protein
VKLESNDIRQLPDRTVQRSICAAHLFGLPDGVQHRSVVPASELAADLL